MKLLCEFGESCNDYQAQHMVNLPCKVLQMDEIWSFVGCKEKAKAKAKGEHPGDVWTWSALCAETKLIPGFYVGDRSGHSAYEFCRDLSTRFSGSLQITTDGLGSYKWAIGNNFANCDYSKMIKIYGTDSQGHEIVTGIKKEKVFGNPDEDLISTSYVERANLTMRMGMRRFTRLTNGFSKKVENHIHSIALHFFHYNFCRKHMTLKTTPAVAASVTDKIWEIEDLIEMHDEYWQSKHPVKRPKRYQKKGTSSIPF